MLSSAVTDSPDQAVAVTNPMTARALPTYLFCRNITAALPGYGQAGPTTALLKVRVHHDVDERAAMGVGLA